MVTMPIMTSRLSLKLSNIHNKMNTIHSLILLQQEDVSSLLSFGIDLLTNDTGFDDITSVTKK